jgi:hypothetical protein
MMAVGLASLATPARHGDWARLCGFNDWLIRLLRHAAVPA